MERSKRVVKRQRGIGTHYPCSHTVDVTFASGVTKNYKFEEEEQPVVNITPGPVVPRIPQLYLSAGPHHMYEKKETMVLDDERMQNQIPATPPISLRNKNLPIKQLERFKPKVGDVIGFVGGKEMIYAGFCSPIVHENLHVITVEGEKFVPMNDIIKILTSTKMYRISNITIRRKLMDTENTIHISSTKGVPYDTLILLKLIGIVAPKTPKVILVNTRSVDMIEAEYGLKVNDGLNWDLK